MNKYYKRPSRKIKDFIKVTKYGDRAHKVLNKCERRTKGAAA